MIVVRRTNNSCCLATRQALSSSVTPQVAYRTLTHVLWSLLALLVVAAAAAADDDDADDDVM